MLDLILSGEEGLVQNVTHNPGLGESDHECIRFVVNCKEEITKPGSTKNYHKADYKTIRERMKNVNWEEQLNDGFTTAYKNFCNIMEKCAEGCIPDHKTGNKLKNIYFTTDAVRLKNLKNKLWRRYTSSRTSYNHTRYITIKNQLRALTRKLRVNFEKEVARNIKTSPKAFWKYVKSRTKARNKIPPLKKTDGTVTKSDLDVAETLNNFFASTFTDETLDNVPISTEELNTGEHLDSFTITPKMVNQKLLDLNPHKTPGPDAWHPMLLKNVADLISVPLSKLFQKSLNEGVVPAEWKEANVTPIHKKGVKNIRGNYRPVSMTSILCKLMESIIRDKIVDYMIRNNLFSKKQHGFVPSRNCMTNLLACMEKWTELVEKGISIDIIYTDFAKAFDRVPHQRLLHKLKNLGITGMTQNWVKAFLHGRRQRVRVNEDFSSWVPVKSGIPQGSVLGPSLFVIFINDMPDMIDSMCQLFADDAKVYRAIAKQDDTESLQSDLDKLSEWSIRWQLPFNVEKCKSLHIGSKNEHQIYNMNGQCLEQVKQEKDLGIVIDDEFKFHQQTAAAIKKANGVLGVIKRSFALLDETIVPTLYKTLVRPHLEYGNVIWGPFYKEDIKAVETIQRRATRMIPTIKHLSYGRRLRELELPSLVHRRKRGDMIFTYKLLNDRLDMDKNDFFKVTNTGTRGHHMKIYKEHATKRSRVNMFSNRVVKNWNGLPSIVVKAETVNAFKEKLDEHWGNEIYDNPFD